MTKDGLINCKKCGTLFFKNSGREVCEECFKKELELIYQIKSFIVSHVSGAQHIETVEHNYRCDDFDYSYRCSTSTISIDNIIDMFKDFDVFIFSMNEYNQLFSKMAMLQINIDNFDNVINQFKALNLQKINT